MQRPEDWLRYFENRHSEWREPIWESASGCLLPRALRDNLAKSLAIFQLGETGGGSRLRRFVHREMNAAPQELSEDYAKAVKLFIAEENEHARLLSELVSYLRGTLRKKHWSNAVFRQVRTLLGLEFNLQVLLIAELIAEAYYSLLYQHVPDPIVRSVCGKIVRDEVGHIGFHQTFFRWRQRGRLPIASAIWSIQLQGLFLVAEKLVWSQHRACLSGFGVEKQEFSRRARSVCRRFLSGVNKPYAEMTEVANPEKLGLVAID